MQSRDEGNNVVYGSLVDKQNLQDMMEKAEERGAVSHTIARLPARDKHFMLGGLEFVINYVDHKRGKLHARLVTGEGAYAGEVAGELAELEVNNHVLAMALAEQVVRDNNFTNNWVDVAHMHTSYISEQDPILFKLPPGKVVKVTVELVDEAEANAV